MQRRLFLRTGSASAVALAVAACGGGGSGGQSSDLAASISLERSATALRAVPGPNAYPFSARLDAYVAGILPSAGAEQMDGVVRASYDAWKARSIGDIASVPGGKVALCFGRDPASHLTLSEGMGYAMLISVVMAGHDPEARVQFDGLLATVRARPAYSVPAPMGAHLMDWRLGADGSSSVQAGGGWNALDGDLDIAMALLMADRQWGSAGRWNYKQEALNTIAAIAAWAMKPDGTTKGLSTPNVSRTSDFMVGHFRAFHRATGDALWARAIDRSYELVDRMQSAYSPRCGLVPDFIVRTDTASPLPSPGGYGDFVDTEGDYFANARRTPWRWGTDFVTSGDERWRSVCTKLVGFIESDSGGQPGAIANGYQLDGQAMGRASAAASMAGPLLCGAMVDERFQGFVDSLWTWNATNFSTGYYDSELQLLPLIVASGNWWNP